jgi:chemotaxis signal transduction protein
MVPNSLRRIVMGFAKADTETTEAINSVEAAHYLSFMVDKQLYAVSVDSVERVVAPQRVVMLPRYLDKPRAAIGAIESRGQIVPVVQLRRRGDADPAPPGVYVILHGEAGLLALGAERAERVMALHPEQIAAPPSDDDLIEGVAILDDSRDILRILAASRIGSPR